MERKGESALAHGCAHACRRRGVRGWKTLAGERNRSQSEKQAEIEGGKKRETKWKRMRAGKNRKIGRVVKEKKVFVKLAKLAKNDRD